MNPLSFNGQVEKKQEIRKEAERKFNLEKEKAESKNIASNDSSSIVSKSDQVAKATTNPKTLSTYKKISDTEILFGRYPQTLVDGSTVKELSNIRFDASKWNDYGYYENGKQSSYMYYIDVDTNGDGVYDYRGVFFTKRRSKYTSFVSSASIFCQEDNGYYTNTIYWFSYDPVKWNVLKTKNGKALIVTSLLIDSQQYCANSTTSSFSHNGGTGYSNDYALSNIRKWLNDTFYDTVFTELEKTIIQVTNVDNSVSSTGYLCNQYACDNTNDRMFLLSYDEVRSLYSSDSVRTVKLSDYAKCQGAYYNSSYDSGVWWLRSPNNNYSNVAGNVLSHGLLGACTVDVAYVGLRAACWIIIDSQSSDV